MPNPAKSPATTQATCPLPQGIGTKPFVSMAAAYDLRVIGVSETAITVQGHKDDLAAFADRLAQLRRPCR